MTGPEHYTEAERLLGPGAVPSNCYGADYDRYRADNLGEAQVHATLALAAAVALRGVSDPDPWLAVAR